MEYVELGDVCRKGSSNIAQKDVANNTGDYPIYGASGLIKYVDFFQQESPCVAVVKDGAVGKTILLPERSSVIGTMQYLIPEDTVDVKYLYYAVSHMNLARYCTGAIIPHIYFKDYRKELMPLPPLPEQREIAGTLTQVDTAIDVCNRILSALDELVKARFIEMFGDPIVNDKGFETKPGKSVFSLSNGKFVSVENRRDSGIPVYGGNGISWYTDDILLEKETIVVGRVGFQSGNVHLAQGPLWVSDNAMYISKMVDRGYSLQFLYAVMEHINFTRFQDAGDLKKITQKPFMEMRYIKPPMELQNQYIAFTEQVDKAKSTVQSILDSLNTLQASLMQEYFG